MTTLSSALNKGYEKVYIIMGEKLFSDITWQSRAHCPVQYVLNMDGRELAQEIYL